MKIIFNILLLAVMAASSGCFKPQPNNDLINSETGITDTIKLPAPELTGEVSLEEALQTRRSMRTYTGESLTINEVGQLLWAAQGITADWGGRTAPSAGGLYPLEIYIAAGNVSNLAAGVYRYVPDGHGLIKVKTTDIRDDLSEAVLNQEWVKDGAVVFIIAADFNRTNQKYGERGDRYVNIEVGHAAQNICLQATALNLGAVTVGAFYDDRVKSTVGIRDAEIPVYVIPVGRKQ